MSPIGGAHDAPNDVLQTPGDSGRLWVSKNERLEWTIRSHYRFVDEQRWDELRAAYAREATYQRGTRSELVGAAAIDRFYRFDRIIAAGRHTITRLEVKSHRVNVRGHFSGTLKSGEAVEIEYRDDYEFTRSGRIRRRISTFPGREV
jgi:hypothetical protein